MRVLVRLNCGWWPARHILLYAPETNFLTGLSVISGLAGVNFH